jgi:hypothetical protein
LEYLIAHGMPPLAGTLLSGYSGTHSLPQVVMSIWPIMTGTPLFTRSKTPKLHNSSSTMALSSATPIMKASLYVPSTSTITSLRYPVPVLGYRTSERGVSTSRHLSRGTTPVIYLRRHFFLVHFRSRPCISSTITALTKRRLRNSHRRFDATNRTFRGARGKRGSTKTNYRC